MENLKTAWYRLHRSLEQLFCRHKHLRYCGKLYDDTHSHMGWYGDCGRCGKKIFLTPGVWPIFIRKLIEVTLKDLPEHLLEEAFTEQSYDFYRLYEK